MVGENTNARLAGAGLVEVAYGNLGWVSVHTVEFGTARVSNLRSVRSAIPLRDTISEVAGLGDSAACAESRSQDRYAS